jgi:quercetin dioxygenase-like cupin family protein
MARVIPIEEVRYTPAVAVFEGHDEAPVSFYVTEFERGEGTPLHLHPYPELFLVERNTALFTAGEEELTVQAGHFVLVPANTPHRYVGASDEAVRVVSVQPSGTVQQTNL